MAYFGEMKLLSFATAPKGWASCNGQLMPIQKNHALFAVLGLTYGGDGRTNFALPDTNGRMLLGADHELALGTTEKTADAPASQRRLGSLALHYVIATEGSFPPGRAISDEPIVGEIRLFAGDFAPRGWLFCDGRSHAFAEFSRLGSILGTTFGGEGQRTFTVPDLGGRVPIGSGTSAIGKSGDAAIQPEKNSKRDAARAVALSYIIAAEPDTYDPFLGEIRAFALTDQYRPEGWLPCNGMKLPIEFYTALFSLLGTRFGGDGKSTFCLPDLRQEAASGSNAAFPAGSTWGTRSTARNGQPFLAIQYCIAAQNATLPPRA